MLGEPLSDGIHPCIIYYDETDMKYHDSFLSCFHNDRRIYHARNVKYRLETQITNINILYTPTKWITAKILYFGRKDKNTSKALMKRPNLIEVT